jgi:SAM-dependent methyltransferase
VDEAHAEAAEFWNGFAAKYNARPGKRTIDLLPDLIGDLDGQLDGSIVLDLACGAGRGSRVLAEQVGDTGLVIGVDLTAAMLDEAEKENGLPNIEYVEAPAEATGLADDAVDHAFCNLGLMLFPSAEDALVELRRVVRPGGTARFAVWGRPEHSSMMTLAVGAANRVGVELPKPPRSNFYLGTPDALGAVAQKTGWSLTASSSSAVRFPYPSGAAACEDLGFTPDDDNPRFRPAVGDKWEAFCAAAEQVADERLEGVGHLQLDILIGVLGDP